MTEKNLNPQPKENKAMQKQAKLKPVKEKNVKAPVHKGEIKEDKIETSKEIKEEKVETKKEEKTETTEDKIETSKETKEEKVETKKEDKKSLKKEFVVAHGIGLHISRKISSDICRFIKNKTIDKAIADLEQVIAMKKPVPMRGEIPHRAGKIMAGRFPGKAAKAFIILLKSLKGNATNHDVEEPIISEAFANKGPKTLGRGGRTEKKRTHVTIIARERKEKAKINGGKK